MRVLVFLIMFFAGGTAANACGNPLLWAMLFAKVPEAKIVYEAELSARADGELEARVYQAKLGQAYHAWSRDWLIALAEEMQVSVDGVLKPGETMTILLADEVAALRFTGGAEPAFIPSAGLSRVDQFDLITTINALNGAWRHGLSYDDMIALDLASPKTSTGETRFATLF